MTISCCFISGTPSLLPLPPPIQRVDLLYRNEQKELEKYIPREPYKQQMCLEVLLCTQIRSISFIPTGDSPQCLYMQRSPEETIKGFITSEQSSGDSIHDNFSIEK